MRVRVWTKRLVAPIAVALVLASCSIATPVTGPGTIGLATFDLSQVGYQRSEAFLSGYARSYSPTAPLTNDGKWTLAPDATLANFKTRMVTFRPIDPAKFNGTVVVEWLNVSAGSDLATDWIMAHNEFVRQGYAYVGVSAQVVGVNALKTQQPDRYGTLVHPGDSYSYDIFSQAGRQVRANPATVLGGLTAQRVIGAGESQSASRLVTYIDGIHPLAQAFDGFMVHSRSSGGSKLTQSPLPDVSVPSPLAIRNDLAQPVMVVQAEGDVIGSNLGARQSDTARFREWELAGTSHADSYTISVGGSDIGNGAGAAQMFAFMRSPQNAGCTNPLNAGPHHWLLQSAYHVLDAWVRDGTPPPTVAPLQVASTSPVVLVRDADGNAVGGVRSPQVDTPVATLTGINSGAGFCVLFGNTVPLTTSQLQAIYPSHSAFVAEWTAAVSSAVAQGFILPDDAVRARRRGRRLHRPELRRVRRPRKPRSPMSRPSHRWRIIRGELGIRPGMDVRRCKTLGCGATFDATAPRDDEIRWCSGTKGLHRHASGGATEGGGRCRAPTPTVRSGSRHPTRGAPGPGPLPVPDDPRSPSRRATPWLVEPARLDRLTAVTGRKKGRNMKRMHRQLRRRVRDLEAENARLRERVHVLEISLHAALPRPEPVALSTSEDERDAAAQVRAPFRWVPTRSCRAAWR